MSRKGDKLIFSRDSGWPKGNLCGLKETKKAAGQKTQAGTAKIREPISSSMELLHATKKCRTKD